MAFNEALAERIRDALARKKSIEERKMFGGIGFLLHGNMLVGVWKNSLIVRVGPEGYEDALLEPVILPCTSWRNRCGLKSNPIGSVLRLEEKSDDRLVLLTEEGNASMLNKLMPVVAAALALAMSPGRADQRKPQADRKEQGIQAEVRGTLHFESGRGYFISVKPADNAGRQMRVWLRAAEDKVLVRKLQGLEGKEVTAKGKLEQMPEDVGASVPPLGIYLCLGFEIEPTKTPTRP